MRKSTSPLSDRAPPATTSERKDSSESGVDGDNTWTMTSMTATDDDSICNSVTCSNTTQCVTDDTGRLSDMCRSRHSSVS